MLCYYPGQLPALSCFAYDEATRNPIGKFPSGERDFANQTYCTERVIYTPSVQQQT